MSETEQEPTRQGDALPVVDGEIVRDAPPAETVSAEEPTAAVLANEEGSPESELSRRKIGEDPVDAPIGGIVGEEEETDGEDE